MSKMKQKIIALYYKLKDGVLRTLTANVINKVISLVSSMVITRLMTPAEYGIWSYALNLYSYLSLITGFGLISGSLQFGSENEGKGRAYNFFRYCVEKGSLINLGIVLIAEVAVIVQNLPIEGAKPFVIAIFPLLLLEFIVMMEQSILRAQNRIGDYANILNINSAFIAAGTCGGAIFGVTGVVAGRYLASILSIIYGGKVLWSDSSKIRNAGELYDDEKKQLWRFSLFTGASSAMNCLVYILDVTIIAELIKSAEDVGVYKVGTLIPNALQFIPSSVVVAILPNIIYHRHNLAWVKKNVRNSFLGLISLNVVISGSIIALSPVIIRIVSGEKYLAAVPVMRILTLGYFIGGTFRGLSINLLAAFRRVHYGFFISVVSCVTDIAANFFFISRYGMIGAAYATLLVDTVTAIISFGYLIYLLRKGTINSEVS